MPAASRSGSTLAMSAVRKVSKLMCGPPPQQSFVHGLTRAITLKPVFNQLDGKTFWIGYVGEIAHITELVRH